MEIADVWKSFTGYWYLDVFGFGIMTSFDTEEEAKAAAQEHWDAFIKSWVEE